MKYRTTTATTKTPQGTPLNKKTHNKLGTKNKLHYKNNNTIEHTQQTTGTHKQKIKTYRKLNKILNKEHYNYLTLYNKNFINIYHNTKQIIEEYIINKEELKKTDINKLQQIIQKINKENKKYKIKITHKNKNRKHERISIKFKTPAKKYLKQTENNQYITYSIKKEIARNIINQAHKI